MAVSSRAWFMWLCAALFFLYEFFLRTFPNSISALLTSDLGLTAISFATLGSAYYIAYAVLQIPVGIMIDRWGVRKLLTVACVICVAGTVLFVFAEGKTSAFLGRFLMGAGSSFAFISLLVISVQWFPRNKLGLLAGATQVLGALGPILAGRPFIAAMKQMDDNWRLVLFFVAIVGVVLTVLIYGLVRDKPNVQLHQQKLPLLSVISEIIKMPMVIFVAIYAFCIYAVMPIFGAVWGVAYLEARGLSTASATAVVSFLWLGLAIGSPLMGWVSDCLQRRKIMLILLAVMGGLASCMLIYMPIVSESIYAGLLLLMGVAVAGQTLSFTVLAESVDQKIQATVMGVNNTAVMLGGAIIPVILGCLLDRFSSGTIAGHYSVEAFQTSLIIVPALFLFALVTALLLIGESYRAASVSARDDKVVTTAAH